jgi:hypothetical protein
VGDGAIAKKARCVQSQLKASTKDNFSRLLMACRGGRQLAQSPFRRFALSIPLASDRKFRHKARGRWAEFR